MLALLTRRPAFRRLFFAGAISLVGDWLTLVAVSLLAVRGDGGPMSLAMVFAAHALPQALGSPLAGPLADRFDRRSVLLAAHLGQAALTVGMLVAAWCSSLPALSLLLLLRSATSALVVPAETAALRGVVEPSELLPANTLIAATWSLSFVAGMALGGALATLGPALAIGLDALSFVLAAALVATLPPSPVDRTDDARAPAHALLAAPGDMLAALRLALHRPELRRAMLAKSPLGLAGGAGWVALNVVATSSHPFGSAAVSLGIVQALRGAGTGVGPLVAQRLLTRGVSPDALGHAAIVSSLGSMTMFVWASHPAWLALAALGWGIGSGTNWVLSTAALQRLAPDSMIGRLSSLDELCATLTMVGSAVGGGALLSRGGALEVVIPAFALVGASSWIALSMRVPAPPAFGSTTSPPALARERRK